MRRFSASNRIGQLVVHHQLLYIYFYDSWLVLDNQRGYDRYVFVPSSLFISDPNLELTPKTLFRSAMFILHADPICYYNNPETPVLEPIRQFIEYDYPIRLVHDF